MRPVVADLYMIAPRFMYKKNVSFRRLLQGLRGNRPGERPQSPATFVSVS